MPNWPDKANGYNRTDFLHVGSVCAAAVLCRRGTHIAGLFQRRGSLLDHEFCLTMNGFLTHQIPLQVHRVLLEIISAWEENFDDAPGISVSLLENNEGLT